MKFQYDDQVVIDSDNDFYNGAIGTVIEHVGNYSIATNNGYQLLEEYLILLRRGDKVTFKEGQLRKI